MNFEFECDAMFDWTILIFSYALVIICKCRFKEINQLIKELFAISAYKQVVLILQRLLLLINIYHILKDLRTKLYQSILNNLDNMAMPFFSLYDVDAS